MKIVKKWIIPACFLLLIGSIARAQQSYTPLDKWLEDHTAEMGGRSVLLVYKQGKIVYSNSVNDLSMRQKMVAKIVAKKQGKAVDLSDFTADTRVQIASCSKWLSAALVMTFVDEGRLRLSDTIGKYLPVMSQNGKGGITVSQCLSHTTGIKAPALKESLQEMKQFQSMDDAVAGIAKLPIEGHPGTVFHYSNVGLQLAGAVIEKISGKSFETLFQERIAGPLNMRQTGFGTGKVALPAGGATSTANDYLNFIVMILEKGKFHGKQVLSEASVAEMQVNRITEGVKIGYSPAEASGSGYGYGEWIMKDAISSPGLFGSYPVVDIKRGYAAVLITFYIKPDGKQERYAALKRNIDKFVVEEL